MACSASRWPTTTRPPGGSTSPMTRAASPAPASGWWRSGRRRPPSAPRASSQTRTVIDGSLTHPSSRSSAPTTASTRSWWRRTTPVRHHRRRRQDQWRSAARCARRTRPPYGKVLHLTPDGAGVPTNPFYSAATPTSWRSRVYAYGIRNPFRLALDPPPARRTSVTSAGTRRGDKRPAPGFNGGWPCFEVRPDHVLHPVRVPGPVRRRSAQTPIWAYPHADAGAAIVAGMHYTGTSYPGAVPRLLLPRRLHPRPDMDDDHRLKGGLTRRPRRTVSPATRAVRWPSTRPQRRRDLCGHQQWQRAPAGLRRGQPAPPSPASPRASDPTTRTVSFSAADSYDLDGDELSFSWDFGDGSGAAGRHAVTPTPRRPGSR